MTKINKTNFALMLAGCMLSMPTLAAEIETNAALMQAMDKVTGRVNKITVPVKSKIEFGDFSLVLRACKKRPAEETPENFAFIDVTDKSFGTDEYNIFRGWVVSSTPGISAIEHPIYDVWLLECIDTKKVDTTKLLTEEELAARDELPTKVAMKDTDLKDSHEDINEEKAEIEEKQPKVIHIKEFIQEDRDIEKNIKEVPAYISESSASYVSDIEEGEEPENLLLFTKMQEVDSDKENKPDSKSKEDNDLSNAIDAEIKGLKNN